MGGGLMQLVAYGAQDVYLTGNPQITFFKVIYRRHTNFSMEAVQQSFNGNPNVNGSNISSTISRNGDLVSNLWLDINMPKISSEVKDDKKYINWVNNTGHAIIKECELEIGGQRIDRHYGHWLDIQNELWDHDEKEWLGLNKHHSKFTYLKNSHTGDHNTKLYVPLKFWFCENPGLALPIIALQYHEVKLKFKFRSILSLINTDTQISTVVDAPVIQLWADYIYLDTDERRRFAQVSHEYLIEQIQRESSGMSLKKKINFNHPVKELIWVIQDNHRITENTNNNGNIDPTKDTYEGRHSNNINNDYFNYLVNNEDSIEYISGQKSIESFNKFTLRLNGHDRFSSRKASYFRTCQPIQAGHKVPTKHIYLYSFALKPGEHQPSGTCNFSRIDNAIMNFDKTKTTTSGNTITVYAINYNVLRIMSGMGGLAYSN